MKPNPTERDVLGHPKSHEVGDEKLLQKGHDELNKWLDRRQSDPAGRIKEHFSMSLNSSDPDTYNLYDGDGILRGYVNVSVIRQAGRRDYFGEMKDQRGYVYKFVYINPGEKEDVQVTNQPSWVFKKFVENLKRPLPQEQYVVKESMLEDIRTLEIPNVRIRKGYTGYDLLDPISKKRGNIVLVATKSGYQYRLGLIRPGSKTAITKNLSSTKSLRTILVAETKRWVDPLERLQASI